MRPPTPLLLLRIPPPLPLNRLAMPLLLPPMRRSMPPLTRALLLPTAADAGAAAADAALPLLTLPPRKRLLRRSKRLL